MIEWFQRLLGRGSPVDLRPLQRKVSEVMLLEPELERLSDHELGDRARRARERARGGAPLDELLPRWFALVREAARRALGLRAFEVQLLGAVALDEGRIVEMATGEGKTLAAVFPASLRALGGAGVHVLTANDYLARRDAQWMRPVYAALGLTVGAVGQASAPEARREAYARDVTYVTASEAGFDHLRDQLATSPADRVHRAFHLALLDEADSILIDEARIPLVIAADASAPDALAYRLAALVSRLEPQRDYVVEDHGRNVALTEAGLTEVEGQLGRGSLHDGENTDLLAAVQVALHARALLRRDVDYVIKEGRIHLVDELKGRVARQRRWPDGIHTALEAKENLPLTREGRVLNAITLQSFLARYPRICGMTGTAATQAEELRAFYGLEVLALPPNRPCIRVDRPDLVFTHREAKERAVVAEIRACRASGRPVLIGTASVMESERLAATLREQQIPCQVLNARHDEEEAAVIARAGQVGAVTISTNMAGRGVDIRLGAAEDADGAERVRALGGLYVIGTNRHENRRIDNQLRGRAGRQGDPGESRFFVSLEDDLFARFGLAEALPRELRGARLETPLEHPRAAAEVDRAQRIIEGQHLKIRQNLHRYDRLLEQQRQALFAWRDDVLSGRTALLLERAPERWRELSEVWGEELLARAERQLLLAQLDRHWAEHLEVVAELREGIHLRSLGRQDPLHEFQKAVVELFDELVARVEEESVATFRRVELTAAGVDLEREGLAAPSSTWTYHITDQPFGTALEQFMKGIRGLIRRESRAG